jgi:hypothetical protein
MEYPNIAKTLIGLQEADLALRGQLARQGRLGQGYHPAMEQLHHQNAGILSDIVDQIGFPTVQKVGQAASDAAWLVAQHAIGQPTFLKKWAELLATAVYAEQADPQGLAYLLDRIAVLEGRPQRYGTQFDWNERGELAACPCDDLIRVDQRRRAIGLNSLEEQTEALRQRAQEEHQAPPPDLAQYQREQELWRKKVGWVK